MTEYQVIARKFRPQTFQRVVGQEAIVTTLKNAMHSQRLAQAYLFCGSRGTGKTTLARIFAKALNCFHLTSEGEPCEQCTSCREIRQGTSLDVIEIDGASHRGIDDIRQINETVGYASSGGGYKIYIIDEVHMLTKEAFNALLKTLEEPPAKVKFFFATTEPNKILPTILSRCQRFNLNRIPLEKMVEKLKWVVKELEVEAQEAALKRIAERAEGGLRDAEALLDQVIAFSDGHLTIEQVDTVLGLMPKESYFKIDQAVQEGNLSCAFDISHELFAQGKDLFHFVDGLLDHFRTLLLIKLCAKEAANFAFSLEEEQSLQRSASIYSNEQCLELIHYLIEAQQKLRQATSSKIALEAILLYVLQSRYRLTIGELVMRLQELEGTIEKQPETLAGPLPLEAIEEKKEKIEKEKIERLQDKNLPPQEKAQATIKQEKLLDPALSEDPTPVATDPPPLKKEVPSFKPNPPPLEEPKKVEKSASSQESSLQPAYIYDTLMQFAAVELEGKLQRH